MEHERIRGDISKGIGDLTGLLETTSALAAQGQSVRFEVEDCEQFSALIWPEVNKIVRVVPATECLITNYPRD